MLGHPAQSARRSAHSRSTCLTRSRAVAATPTFNNLYSSGMIAVTCFVVGTCRGLWTAVKAGIARGD